MLKLIGKSILAKFAFDAVAGAAHAVSVWTAALDHEAINDSVKNQAVIEALLTRLIKLLTLFGAMEG